MKGVGVSGISPTVIWVLNRLDEEMMHEWRGDTRILTGELKDLVVLMDLPYSESLGDHDDSVYLSDLNVPERDRKIVVREWVMGWMLRLMSLMV
jgi:hypothetical protein